MPTVHEDYSVKGFLLRASDLLSWIHGQSLITNKKTWRDFIANILQKYVFINTNSEIWKTKALVYYDFLKCSYRQIEYIGWNLTLKHILCARKNFIKQCHIPHIKRPERLSKVFIQLGWTPDHSNSKEDILSLFKLNR